MCAKNVTPVDDLKNQQLKQIVIHFIDPDVTCGETQRILSI